MYSFLLLGCQGTSMRFHRNIFYAYFMVIQLHIHVHKKIKMFNSQLYSLIERTDLANDMHEHY